MKLHRLFVSSLIITSLAVATTALAADAPSVDSILTKYVTALGGKAAMEKVTSQLLKIKLESENMGGPSEGEVCAKLPNKQVSHIELNGVGTMDEGFDGTVAWARTPWETGVRVKTGDELAKVKRDAEFHRELKLKTLYPDLAYKGTEKVGEEEAYLLESKPSASSKEKMLFSSKTGLLIRQESDFEGPQGAVSLVMLPQEYKTLNGLKYPSQIKMKVSTGGQTFEFMMKIVDVKHNVTIEDAKFAKPSA
jgi:zinc protease